MEQRRLKDILVIVIILIIAKIAIAYCYEQKLFSVEHIKYNFYINSMENIDSEEFSNIILNSEQGVQIIYMGRESCPVCIDLFPKIKTIFNKFQTFDMNGEEVKVNQYYFDSEKNKTNLAQQIRNEINADTVPVIIVVKEGKVVLFDSSSLVLLDYVEKFENILNS